MTEPQEPEGMIPIVALVRRRLAELGKPDLRPLAKEAGVPYGTLQRYQNPTLPLLRSGMRKETIKNLAKVLQLPVSVIEAAERDSMDRVRQNEEPNAAISNPVVDLPGGLRAVGALYESLPQEDRAEFDRQMELLAALWQSRRDGPRRKAHGGD